MGCSLPLSLNFVYVLCALFLLPYKSLSSSAVVLQSSDFDFLLSKGSNADPLPNSRDSLLLRFDPLLGRSILVTQPTAAATAPTIKEEPSDESFTSATSTSMQDNNSPQDNRQQRYCLSTTLPLEDNTSEEAAGEDRDFESVFNRAGLAASSSRESNAVSIFSDGFVDIFLCTNYIFAIDPNRCFLSLLCRQMLR